ncbi:MAG: DNA polymerase III subunit beta [Marivibrio sp.]|uniref:DNA polymerase III subunit beta n=1 Tax=Marivibrio sp. TaxID=2039719 RepID=UPI0032EF890C
MKLTIERAALLRALNHVQSVVERRNTIPILSNVLIDSKDGALGLTATDMDIAIVERTAAEVATAGAVTAPAHTLYDIVRKLPDGAQVDLDATGEGDRLTLKSGRSRFTLATLPTDDFPVMSGGDMPHEFQLDAEALRALIDRTRFAISTEETRYYLNGIYLHAADGETPMLRAVATDGHRLARVEIPLPDGAGGMPGVIVPRKTVSELRKLIEETDGAVSISLSDTKIRFAFGDAVLTSKLIDGTFPDYERVIPSGNDKIMTVDCSDFAEAVDRVSTIATEKMRAVKMKLDGDQMELSASSQENGQAVEELAIDYGREAIEIGFNARYLLDIANQVEGDAAEFVMADAASPTIVRDPKDPGALYVLMPMRV